MEQKPVAEERVEVRAQNIGGIDRTEVTFEPGITILTGRNATHKTSLLQAIMAGLGSTNVSLKSDAKSGSVSLKIGNKTATVELSRQNGDVQFTGEPYQDDIELADLFAFLLSSNEARRTVELGGNLRDIVMRPVDTDAIQAEISRLQSEKAEITEQIDAQSDLQSELADLKQRRSELETEIETAQENLAAKREELADHSDEADEVRAENSELDAKMDELQERRSDLDTVAFQIDSQRESLDSLRSEHEELTEATVELPDDVAADIEEIETEISRLRSEKQQLESDLSSLQNVIQFNEEMLDGDNEEIASALQDNDGNEAVTDQLLETDETVCWTCGTAVAQDRIQETLAALRELRQTKYSTQQQVEEELAELTDERSTLEDRQQRRETVERKLTEVEEEIETREAKLEELEAERERLEQEIDQLEEEVTQLEREDMSEVLDLEREVNELEFEVSRLEDNRESITEQIEEIETTIEERSELEERREQLAEQLTELRTRVDRIEEQAVSEFNAHMEAVLDILEYENLDRIWIDRVEQETKQGRRKVTETVFQLHIVRSTGDGITYEDEFENLSESEREVTALVFALAGYLVHDVHEEVPFILLDSLDAIDAQRIDALLDYLAEYAEYLVVTLLPEDAEAVDDSYQYVSEI
jgi:chromosome segregation ATPase